MLQSTLEARIETGPLAEIFPKFDPSTLRHADEAMIFRASHQKQKDTPLWTANFSMYRSENEAGFLYFAPRKHNLLFRALENEATRSHAINQLLTTGNYVPSKEGIDEVIAAVLAGKALKIRISDLQLQKHKQSDAYGFFDVDPNSLDVLNPAQRSFVKAIYGNSKSKPGIRVYVLDESYVKNTLKGKEDSAIARASRLDKACYGSWFIAGDRGVGYALGGLLGVLKEGAESAAKN